jgi:L-asparaginase
MPPGSARPRVLVFSLGGTIAMAPTGQPGGGVAPRLTGADLVAAVPGLGEGVEVLVEDFRQAPGAWLTPDDVAELAVRLSKAADDASGFVVTQGTDTLEETAYLLDLLYHGAAPLVLTGAMRNPSMAGADGPANLLAAVRVAASPHARELGALVVFADQIHAARHVRKSHTTSVAAFTSPDAGPIGHVVEGRVRLHARPGRLPAIEPPFTRPARVEILTASLGGSDVLLGAARHLDGLVVAAFGAGHVPDTWADPLAELAARVPVVLTSRIGAGSVLTSTYGFTGAESDLLARGLVHGGALDPHKARLLLIACLRTGGDRAAVTTAFRERA